MSNFEYDLVVIGAGSGGVRAARISASLGAKVAVIENRYMGGTCVNVGCVPKKLFMYGSAYGELFREAQGFGWSTSEPPTFNWDTLRDNKTREITRLNKVYDGLLDKHHVDIVSGTGKIVHANQVEVDGKQLHTQRILIATGGWPTQPRYPGAEFTTNSNDFFYLEHLPKRVLVEGGGYIAVEFACILNGLGCETELVYRGQHFLRGFDNEMRYFIAEQIREKGITLSFETRIESIEKSLDSYQVQLSTGNTKEVDCIVSAIGRRPMLDDLGIENTSIEQNPNGTLIVDQHFETSEKNIFALGDVVGRMALTPVALKEGESLARYLFDKTPIDIDYQNIPTAIFTQPNAATVGLSEEQAEEQGLKVKCYTSNFKPMKHTLSGLNERNFMKLIVEQNSQRIVGCHMVGDSSAEIIQGIAIAVKMGATKPDFDNTFGIHPTAAEEFVTMR